MDAAEYEVITGGLASFFGDSTYLVLGANNAEMQIGGGMHLSVGRVVVIDGDFELPGLEPSASIFPVAVTPWSTKMSRIDGVSCSCPTTSGS